MAKIIERLTDDEAYANAAAKEQALAVRESEASKRLEAAETERRTERDYTGIERAGMAILGIECATSRQKIETARNELAAIQEARRIQRGILDGERGRVSALISQSKRPAYAKIVQQMNTALQQLKEAAAAERRFREAAREGDWSLGQITPMVFIASINSSEELDDAVDRWQAEAKSYRYL